MNERLLNRRQFGAQCVALASGTLIAAQAGAQDLGTAPAVKPRTVKFPDGPVVPALGQGCWHLGQGRHAQYIEEEALRTGIDLGMTVIDTSGNYGDGLSEKVISHVISDRRERVFLVSKVEDYEVSGDGILHACEASLARLGTSYLDLYLLHAPVPNRLFAGVVAKFEQLRAAGKIRRWGVSNFNVEQMEALIAVPDGQRCATNQVLYNLSNRSIERDLLPWCDKHNMPVMAYSPLGGEENLVLYDPMLKGLAAKNGYTTAAVALAWVMRSGNVIAIPESGSPEHVKENAAALSIRSLSF